MFRSRRRFRRRFGRRRFGRRFRRFFRRTVRQPRRRITRNKISQFLFPDQMMVKMKVHYGVQLDSTAGAIDFYSPFGNEYVRSSGGVSNFYPDGFVQYANIYSTSRILFNKITITFVNQGVTSAVVGVLPYTTVQTTPANNRNVGYDRNNLQQQPFNKSRTLAPTNGIDRGVVTNAMSTKKMFGQKIANDAFYEIDHYYNVSTHLFENHISITNTWNWFIYMYPLLIAEDATCDADIIMEYYIRFEDPRQGLPLAVPQNGPS